MSDVSLVDRYGGTGTKKFGSNIEDTVDLRMTQENYDSDELLTESIGDEKLFVTVSKEINHIGDSISNLCVSNDENSYSVEVLDAMLERKALELVLILRKSAHTCFDLEFCESGLNLNAKMTEC
ncbi:Hypothetical predicted protein [Olea europaea subsp. europaea]|uniref:Uncharacterized protein n=1 Tax=Olea europaea subsp. europaea TaxID=158383 RepID=A0A8S0R4B1_OLEEU|nr:Hypothetical predicted protein [Olea europaea subsp. europaea]